MKFLICYGSDRDIEIVEAKDSEAAAHEFLAARDQLTSVEVYPVDNGTRFTWSRELQRETIVDYERG